MADEWLSSPFVWSMVMKEIERLKPGVWLSSCILDMYLMTTWSNLRQKKSRYIEINLVEELRCRAERNKKQVETIRAHHIQDVHGLDKCNRAYVCIAFLHGNHFSTLYMDFGLEVIYIYGAHSSAMKEEVCLGWKDWEALKLNHLWNNVGIIYDGQTVTQPPKAVWAVEWKQVRYI
jgi:hypothetical protein